MDLVLDPRAPVPVYRQLADQVHFAINTGRLQPGERLPSLRSIAAQHGLAVNTCAKAFQILVERGVVTSGVRSGYRVSSNLSVAPPAEPSARYSTRGVSAVKGAVHSALEGVDPGVFPGAFCKLTEDYLTGDPERCNVIHADGSGTKSLIAYLQYRETGDASVFRGIAQDSIVMNLDDLLCVGVSGRVLLSSTINRNARRVGPEVLRELISGTEAFLGHLRGLGVEIYSGGGETADVGDLTPTLVVDSCATAVLRKSEVLNADRIVPGLCIVGLASDGQANYEGQANSGIGSNGLTSARHDLLSRYYAEKYPESYDAAMPPALAYCGPYRLDDPLPDSPFSVAEALLSPTRTYAPIVLSLLRELGPAVCALIHCSGGGQTKCLRFGQGVHYVKDRLRNPPAIFQVIQKTSATPWQEMYQVFNMGHRLEVYCAQNDADEVISIAGRFGVEAQIIGHTTAATAERNGLTLHHGRQTFQYAAP
jgi:phosphoribosylformylglycinamidine cyclo-ligase